MNENQAGQIQVFDTPGPVDVSVDVQAGSLHVAAADTAVSEVVVRPADPADDSDVAAAAQTRVVLAGNQLRVVGPRHWRQSLGTRTRSVAVSVTVPAGSSLGTRLGLGDVTTQGRLGSCRVGTGAGHLRLAACGALTAATGAGDVQVGHVDGAVEARTGSGTVQLGTLGGAAAVRNGNGRTEIARVDGSLRVRAGNGDVTLGRCGGPVDVRASNGAIRVAEVVSGDVALAARMGDIEVGVADGTAAWLEVRTGFGRVDSQLAAAAAPADDDPRVRIHAQTSFGDVRVRRAAPRAVSS